MTRCRAGAGNQNATINNVTAIQMSQAMTRRDGCNCTVTGWLDPGNRMGKASAWSSRLLSALRAVLSEGSMVLPVTAAGRGAVVGGRARERVVWVGPAAVAGFVVTTEAGADVGAEPEATAVGPGGAAVVGTLPAGSPVDLDAVVGVVPPGAGSEGVVGGAVTAVVGLDPPRSPPSSGIVVPVVAVGVDDVGVEVEGVDVGVEVEDEDVDDVVPPTLPPSPGPIRVGIGPLAVVTVDPVPVVGTVLAVEGVVVGPLVAGVLVVGPAVVVVAVAAAVVVVETLTALPSTPSSATVTKVSARAIPAGEAAKARHDSDAIMMAANAARVGSLRRLLALVTLSDFSPVPDPARTLKADGANGAACRAKSTLQVGNGEAVARGHRRR